MHANKFLLSALSILLISMLACNFQSASPFPETGLPATETPVDLSAALAASLTAIANAATATLTPTEAPSQTFTPISGTDTPTNTPTETFTVTRTFTPSYTPTQTFTPSLTNTTGFQIIGPILLGTLHPILPINPAKLDYTANANYGEANLGAGFAPDPYSVGMTTGGTVNVSYLGSSCSGFATVGPDLRVNFAGGGSSLLRVYFKGNNGDSSMVINDPYGNYYCVDDSFGTLNPTIDFNNPAGGSYDIWIDSQVSGSTISGTLYLTENAGNHP